MMKVEQIKLKSFGEGMMPELNSQGARVFIPSTRAPEPEAPPPPPTFSEAELKAAERDGFQKGFIEGTKEGHKQAESQQHNTNVSIASLAAQFSASVLPLFEHYRKFNETLRAEMPKVALAIAQKVAGSALQENAHLLVADIATRACETMMSEARLTITANDTLGDKLEQLLQTLASRLPEQTEIVILRDPAMPIADCRIDWKLGSMQHSVDELWERIAKAVENLATVATRDAAEDMAQLQQQVENPAPLETENESKE